MKKIGKYLGMAAGLSVLMLGTAGCEKEVQTAVVAEKNVNAASMENGAQEEGREIEYFDEAEDISPMMSLKEQVNAPETYTADFEEHREFVEGEESTGREMTVHVTADASVEIPEAEYVRLKKIRTAVNSEEQVKAWLEALCDDEEEFLKSWEERETETYGQEQKLEIVDGKIKIDGVPYRFQYDREKYNVYLEREAVIEQEGNEETVRDNAAVSDSLIKKLGFSDFQLAGSSLGIQKYTSDEGEKVFHFGDYQYERLVDGIPVNYTAEEVYPLYEKTRKEEAGQSYEVSNIWKPETLELGLDGEMLFDFSYANRAEISDYSDERLFVLSFEEIRRIFEDTIAPKMTGVSGKAIQGLTGQVLYPGYEAADRQQVQVDITKVKFGYMKKREKDSPTEGILIPVWDFYGTWNSKAEDGSGEEQKMDTPEVSLVTLDARDGTVIDRRCWY